MCIADGTGGLAGGAIAAEMFIDRVRRATELPAFDVTSADAWVDCFDTVDHAIERNPQAGETTGIALAIAPNAMLAQAAVMAKPG